MRENEERYIAPTQINGIRAANDDIHRVKYQKKDLCKQLEHCPNTYVFR